jgi:hypothetical protein
VPALSDLTEMRTGHGYWLYMTSAEVLVYGGLPKPAAELPHLDVFPQNARTGLAADACSRENLSHRRARGDCQNGL